MSRRLSALTAVLLLPGCATLMGGTTTPVTVQTDPVSPPAACHLATSKGQWDVIATPSAVAVARGSGDLIVTCTGTDGTHGAITVPATDNMALWGNVLFGGLIGVAVDSASGAAWGYPSPITVPLVQPVMATAPLVPVAVPTQ